MNKEDINILLDKKFNSINKIILSRQDAITGLLPASTAINAHGDYTDAWVRDNVYSILSVWGLSLSYKKYAPKHYVDIGLVATTSTQTMLSIALALSFNFVLPVIS